jgi:hypothetical protein
MIMIIIIIIPRTCFIRAHFLIAVWVKFARKEIRTDLTY